MSHPEKKTTIFFSFQAVSLIFRSMTRSEYLAPEIAQYPHSEYMKNVEEVRKYATHVVVGKDHNLHGEGRTKAMRAN